MKYYSGVSKRDSSLENYTTVTIISLFITLVAESHVKYKQFIGKSCITAIRAPNARQPTTEAS